MDQTLAEAYTLDTSLGDMKLSRMRLGDVTFQELGRHKQKLYINKYYQQHRFSGRWAILAIIVSKVFNKEKNEVNIRARDQLFDKV